MIPVAEYLPDLPALENPGANEALNVIPAAKSYRPFPSMVESGGAASTVRVQGAAAFRSTDLSVKIFAGDIDSLYSVSTGTWGDVSGATYTTPPTAMWRYTQFGDDALAVNGSDPIQAFAMTAGSAFADLSGASAADGSKYICVVRDVVVAGRPSAASNRILWCDTNDDTNWTTGVADHQDMPDGGQIMGLVGGQQLYIFQERAIRVGTTTGTNLQFTFDKISEDLGLFAEYSLAAYQNVCFFLSSDGLYMLSGGQLTAIGAEKIDKTLLADIDLGNLDRITGAVDPINKLYILGYPATGGDGTPTKAVIYNWQLNRFARAEFDHEFLYSGMVQSAWNVDNLDSLLGNTDATDALVDSPQFSGSGRLILSAFSTAHKNAYFDGENMAATVDTTEAQLSPMQRSYVTEVWPYSDGGSPTITIGTRDLPTEAVTWGSETSMNSTGKCPVRSDARFHRARIKQAAGAAWTHVQGIQPIFQPSGQR